MPPREKHHGHVTGWLRAAVLGANDGLISTSSLILGVAAASPGPGTIVLAGVAGLISGALSMAAGEYVSVSSQADSEKADLAMERDALDTAPEEELAELKEIYVARGLTPELAQQVAEQLSAGDVLEAHARDELGMFEHTRARPLQAALYSAAAFTVGAAMPVLLASLAPPETLHWSIVISTLFLLLGLGSLAARLGGASPLAGGVRVVFWGAMAMAATAIVGSWFGTVV